MGANFPLSPYNERVLLMLEFFAFLYGLIFGSFFNVVIYRLPLGLSLIEPSSHCPSCHTKLRPLDLIPVFSWLTLCGRCRYCSDKISAFYPLIELFNGLGWLLIIKEWGLAPQGIAGAFLFSLALIITMIDLKHYLIPNSLVLMLLGGGIIYHFAVPPLSVVDRLIGLAVGLAVPLLLYFISHGGMGGGDIKLMGAMGFWLGFPGVLMALFIAALMGSVVEIGRAHV